MSTERTYSMPFQCRGCGEVYDGASVTVTGRYADCDLWKAPCCGATHDTRTRWGGPSWAKMGYDDLREYRRVEREVYPVGGWRA